MERNQGTRRDAVAGLRGRLTARLVEHLDVSSIRLWRVTPHGERVVHGSGDGPFVASLPIRSRGRTVGRLEVDRADPTHAAALDHIALWLEIVLEAIESCSEGGGGKVQDAAAIWRLTPAQTRVLEQIALGRSEAEIGPALGLPHRAVEIHVGRILRVTGAATAREVAARLAAIAASGAKAFARSPGDANRPDASLRPVPATNRPP